MTTQCTEKTLADLAPGKSAHISSLTAEKAFCQRLGDLGFLPGMKICCLFPAPGGSPIAFQICGAVIALRRQDAERIQISLAEQGA